VSVLLAGVLPLLGVPAALADPTCGLSNGHTLCITLPSTTLTGDATVTVTNSPNNGTVLYTWLPSGASKSVMLMTQTGRAGLTGNYSFVWPTTKYLDASGSLNVQIKGGAAVSVGVTLQNGNLSDIVHTPNDWETYLPLAWTGATDPIVPAVGDGPDGVAKANAVAAMVAGTDPPLALFLGDVYEAGTYVENRNHYGLSSIDSPGAGTLWGAFANVTQPTLGNHGTAQAAAFIDYWHQRPRYMSFDLGGVRFIDLDSTQTAGFQPGGDQYAFVQEQLATAPACVIAFFHHPVLNKTTVNTKILPMWQLLANGGAELELNGHVHVMGEYEPLDANLQVSPDAHLVELISGAGGHQTGVQSAQGHLVWTSSTSTTGAVFITLVGAANGGTASSLAWTFEDVKGNVLRTGSVACT